jgi:hypothetical protein
VIAVLQDDDIGLRREYAGRDEQDDRRGQQRPDRQLAVCLRPVTAYGLPFKAFEMSRIDR